MKRIVLCLDGTWNNAVKRTERDGRGAVYKPSNVLKLCRGVRIRDDLGVAQICWYDAGVGASARYPGAANRGLAWIDRHLGGVWGAGFEGNVEDAFTFLVHNAEVGDEVHVFGFSRGATQARAVCRFLEWCGGLPDKADAYYVPELFRSYLEARGAGSAEPVVETIDRRRRDEVRSAPLRPFLPVRVRLLAVWDTVAALGSRVRSGRRTSARGKAFHVGETVPGCVDHARQALAIDEARWDFRPEIWSGVDGPGRTLEQRWFAGAHSNVGGGLRHDGLANLSLRWLAGEARNLGLALDEDHLSAYSGYPMDELTPAGGLLRIRDAAVRLVRGGSGRRILEPPRESANLSLDLSVLHRVNADPQERDGSGQRRHPHLELYRPGNLRVYLAAHPELHDRLGESALAWVLGREAD